MSGRSTGNSLAYKSRKCGDGGQPIDIEYMHCSSYTQSLDGIVIPLLSIAMVDETAPQVIDPKTHGAVDEIINLGEYWDAAPIKACKDGIMKTAQAISELLGAASQ